LLSICKGDYIKWVTGITTFAASSQGEVYPIEKEYAYGIVIAVAEAIDIGSDVIIAYNVNSGDDERWLVASVDDEDYCIQLVSKVR